ncbi:MAG: hypothetical protein M3R38_29850 [Actinomycetota bacterium]|nr:hypothetical protein [Actinomycetota bacterium]
MLDPTVVGAFVTLLTPLAAMAGAVFLLLTRRIRKLEQSEARLIGYVLTTCVDKAEGMEKLADIIVAKGVSDE